MALITASFLGSDASEQRVHVGPGRALERGQRGRRDFDVQSHDIVSGGQLQAAMAECLANDSLQGIARGGARGEPLRDDQAQARLRRLFRGRLAGSGGAEHEESPSGQPAPFQGSGELRGAMQPRLWGKRGARHERPGIGAWNADSPVPALDGQALAAFGAASVQHGTAGAGFHAQAKAMGTLAAGNGRLVGAFHGRSTKRTKVRRDLPDRFLATTPYIVLAHLTEGVSLTQ